MCGSRNWTDHELIRDELAEHDDGLPIELLHGAAVGADTIAAKIATDFGWDVRAFPADWEAHGRRAGILRNLAMLDERPDLIIAFQRSLSRGTQHTIDEALLRHIRVVLVRRP